MVIYFHTVLRHKREVVKRCELIEQDRRWVWPGAIVYQPARDVGVESRRDLVKKVLPECQQAGSSPNSEEVRTVSMLPTIAKFAVLSLRAVTKKP